MRVGTLCPNIQVLSDIRVQALAYHLGQLLTLLLGLPLGEAQHLDAYGLGQL